MRCLNFPVYQHFCRSSPAFSSFFLCHAALSRGAGREVWFLLAHAAQSPAQLCPSSTDTRLWATHRACLFGRKVLRTCLPWATSLCKRHVCTVRPSATFPTLVSGLPRSSRDVPSPRRTLSAYWACRQPLSCFLRSIFSCFHDRILLLLFTAPSLVLLARAR